MSLSACAKCWDNPCHCGHEYKDWSDEKKLDIIAAIVGRSEQNELDAARYRKLRHHLCPDLCDFMQAKVSDDLDFNKLVDGLDDIPMNF